MKRLTVLFSCAVVLALFASLVMGGGARVAAEEPITIRFISQFGIGAEPQPLWDEVAAEFMKENPNIKVEMDWAGAEWMTKFRAELSAGHPHDIYWDNEADIAMLAREGVNLNLTEYLEKTNNFEGDKVWKDSFIPAILQRAWVEDGADGPGYYGIPDEQFIDGIFYNKAIFEKYAIKVPTTWSEFLAACETLKQNGMTPIAADGTYSPYNSFWFYDLAMRLVGSQLVYDTAMNKPGTSFKDNPDFLKVAQMVYELKNKGYMMKGFEGSAWPAAQMEFIQGKAAMMLMKSWLPGEMLPNTAEDFRYGFFAFPMVEGGKGDPTTVQVKYNGFVVAKDSKNPDAAIAFIRKLTSRKVQEQLVARAWYPGVLPGLTVPDNLKETVPVLENAKKVVGFGVGLDRDAAEWQVKVLDPLDDQLFFNLITPENFIEELQKAHEAYYAQKK
jgi:raffinose/stachyose/melibiose transport system substrate-binding protein